MKERAKSTADAISDSIGESLGAPAHAPPHASSSDLPEPKPLLVLKPAKPKAAVAGVTRNRKNLPEIPSSRVVKIGAALAIAGALAYLTWPSSSASDADATAGVDRLAALDLAVAFPDGWHLAADPTAGSPHAKTAVLLRGSAADPEQQAFVAELPLAGPLADAAASDARLLAVAHDAERGAEAHLTAAHATYYSEGCTAIGPHAAKCRGTSTTSSATRTVITHVKLGAARAIVALFVSRSARDGDVDAIALSMKP